MALTLTGNTLSKISFCDKQCSNINDNKIKAQILQNLDTKYKLQVCTRDYNIINPNILRNVSYNQHILSTYTHGNPYMLYLTKIDGINCVIYIDKKLKEGYTYPKMHCVKYRFADELFQKDTIFTGELVRDTERRWFFLIDNILLYKGLATTEKNILSKFELIHNIMANEYKADKFLEICPLHIKKLFLYKDIKKMVTDFIPNLSYKCKGIIFYTLNNKHSNYAFLIPRETQIEIKSSSDVDDIIQTKYPLLWDKKNSVTKSINVNIGEYINDVSSSDANSYNTYNESSNESSNGSGNGSGNGSSNEYGNVSNINNDSISLNPLEDLKLVTVTNTNTNSNTNTNTNSNTNTNTNTNSNTNTNTNTNVMTIDSNNAVFKILKTDMPDIYNLYCIEYETKSLLKYAIALIPNIKISHYLHYAFVSKTNNIDMKIECKFSQVFEKWTPVRFVDNEPYNSNMINTLKEKLKNKA